jgi:hypothetical protein
MPTLERSCFLCARPVVLVSSSPGPYANWAAMHGRALCDDCIADRQIPIDKSDPHDPFIAWSDGDEFRPVGGVFIGAPCRNPASSSYEPPNRSETQTVPG